jgi:hypothetical protein
MKFKKVASRDRHLRGRETKMKIFVRYQNFGFCLHSESHQINRLGGLKSENESIAARLGWPFSFFFHGQMLVEQFSEAREECKRVMRAISMP